jgi:hypothetical protein
MSFFSSYTLLHRMVGTWMLLLIGNCTVAQLMTTTEKRFYDHSIEYALDNLIKDQSGLYAGPLYHQYFIKMGNDGHPFYHDLRPESIVYDNILYAPADFIYDIFIDEVIVINPDSNWISLDKRKISQFFLGGHKFEKIERLPGLAPGFYEIVYRDNTRSLLAKWKKVFSASVWKGKVSFFVVDDKVHPVQSKKEMINMFSDKEREVKAFIRQHKLKFKRGESSSYKKVIEFYSSLHN